MGEIITDLFVVRREDKAALLWQRSLTSHTSARDQLKGQAAVRN